VSVELTDPFWYLRDQSRVSFIYELSKPFAQLSTIHSMVLTNSERMFSPRVERRP